MEQVWRRMQEYPHCFELAAARGELAVLNMGGTPCTGPPAVVALGRLSILGWKVDVAGVDDYRAEGVLSESLLQALFLLVRDRWPANSYVFRPHLVRKREVSRTLPQHRTGKRVQDESLPEIACFPYRSIKSKQWVLYVLVAAPVACGNALLLLFRRASFPEAALATTTAYMESFFKVRVEERELPAKEFTDLSVFFAAVEVTTGKLFDSCQESAKRTGVDTEHFFTSLLEEMAATRCTDLADFAASKPALGQFVRDFLAQELPTSTARPAFSLRPQRSLWTGPTLAKADSAPLLGKRQPTL